MKKSKLKTLGIILAIIMLSFTLMPICSNADEEKLEVIAFEKANEDMIFYIKGYESTDFKYAFSDTEETPTTGFVTCITDSKGENVAYLAKGKTYKYMFIADKTGIHSTNISTIKQNEIEEIEELTKIIPVDTKQTESSTKTEGDTTITTTTGKIVITENGDFKYQLIKIADENKDAVELYNELQKLSTQTSGYEKLLLEMNIRDNYKKMLENAIWSNVEEKTIHQPENSLNGEKYLVLMQKVENNEIEKSDLQIMTCLREDDKGKNQIEETAKVEKKTKLPITGENLAMYIALGIIIIAIIAVVVRMYIFKNKKNEEK